MRNTGQLVGTGETEGEDRLDAELGYAMAGPNGWGLVTRYAGVSLGEGAGRTLRSGLRWNASQSARAALETIRDERASDERARHALMLRAQVRF